MKIAPGVHINLSKRGTGVSFGHRGVHLSFSPTGRVTKTVSLPGTGIYYRDVSSLHQKDATESRAPSSDIPQSAAPEQYPQHSPRAHHVEAVEHHGFYISHGVTTFLAIFAAGMVQGYCKQSGVNPYSIVFIAIGLFTFVLWVRDLVISAKERRVSDE